MGKKSKRAKHIKAGKRARILLECKFSVGNLVVVKQGIADPDFPDIPLGGWVGTIRQVDPKESPPLYLIEWNRDTLAGMHPVFRNRCERDGLELESMWLAEDDIELFQGQPVVIEQPTAIVTRPLSSDDQDDRIRIVMGLTHDDLVPDVDEETLLIYYRYLSDKLVFPFDAECDQETADGYIVHRVQVLGLLDPDEFECDDFYGLFCEAREGRSKLHIPLGEVEAKKKDPNRQLLSDYSYWFWNCR